MIDHRQARQIVTDWLTKQPTPALYILDDATLETEFGRVSFYTSEHPVAGNAPVIVDRRGGALQATGTAQPVEYYINQYRRERGLGPA